MHRWRTRCAYGLVGLLTIPSACGFEVSPKLSGEESIAKFSDIEVAGFDSNADGMTVVVGSKYVTVPGYIGWVGTSRVYLMAFDSTGGKHWEFAGMQGGADGVRIGADGTAYVTSSVSGGMRNEIYLTAYSVSGAQKWRLPIEPNACLDFQLGVDENLYCTSGTGDSVVYASDGTIVSKRTLPGGRGRQEKPFTGYAFVGDGQWVTSRHKDGNLDIAWVKPDEHKSDKLESTTTFDADGPIYLIAAGQERVVLAQYNRSDEAVEDRIYLVNRDGTASKLALPVDSIKVVSSVVTADQVVVAGRVGDGRSDGDLIRSGHDFTHVMTYGMDAELQSHRSARIGQMESAGDGLDMNPVQVQVQRDGRVEVVGYGGAGGSWLWRVQ